MPSRRVRPSVIGFLRKGWLYLLIAVALLGVGGLIWGFRDHLRSPSDLYREARTAPHSRAIRLYALLMAKVPELEEYCRLWSAQVRMPSFDAVAALHEVTRFRPDSPPAYHAHLGLARHYAQIESPRTIDEYEAALALNDTVELRLELARYLEEQNASRGAYRQYVEMLGRDRLDAFGDMRRTGSDPLAVAEDLLKSHFYSDVVDVLRGEDACQAHCLLATALWRLGRTKEAAEEEQACGACTGNSGAQSGEANVDTVDERQRLLSSSDPVDWWRATWDMDVQATVNKTIPLSDVIPIYLRIAENDVYVSDDAAYRALVLARRDGDVQAENRALGLLQEMKPNWYAWKATGDLPMDLAPPYPDAAMEALVADILNKATALELLGRRDLAYEELRFAALVSETPEVILRMAQELSARGKVSAAYTLGVPFLTDHPYAPVAFWELAYPRAFSGLVTRWAKEYGVEPELVWAVMRQESEFIAEARSSAGAMGLMQLMRQSVDDFSGAHGADYAPGDAYRPEVNIQVGARHLSDLLGHYNGDRELALMAYNAGPGNVDEWLQEPTSRDWDDLLRFIPYGETREYVSRVSLNYLIYRALYAEAE